MIVSTYWRISGLLFVDGEETKDFLDGSIRGVL